MIKLNILAIFALSIILFSCGSNSGKNNSGFSIEAQRQNNEFHIGENLSASLQNNNNNQIDSVAWFFEGKAVSGSNQKNAISIPIKNQKLGNQKLLAVVYQANKKDSVSLDVKLYNDESPVTYTYKITNTYPHDIHAYTQGLEFYNDTLYESTGEYGASSLREVALESGKVLKKIDLAENYFGEGLTIWKDKIYQLTWRAGKGFIYNLNDFKKTGSFSYNKSKEGWGLTHDGKKIYKSDGTEKIWILDPETLAEQSYIQTVTNRTISSKLNELEWVDGKIYANTYQKDGVAIINPENGAVEGLIDFRGLREKVTQHASLDVLNGIAYNPHTKKLYVTGKNWDKLFEVEIIKK